MRPVRRNASPNGGGYDPYKSAFTPLIIAIGNYCSYCERRVEVSLAVEHIQPKGLPAYAALETVWENFLVSCANCNSTKGHQNVVLASVLLPDRDNTFLAYDYEPDGSMNVSSALSPALQGPAAELLRLTGLDRTATAVLDDNDIQMVVDRFSKRISVFGIARDMLGKLDKRPNDADYIDAIIRVAIAEGLFSIWMKVFKGYPQVCCQLIDAHRGTRESGCFDLTTQAPISPHPNTDGLVPGGRL